ncbi:universal stress protein [Acinetobacter haemolyticus]|uniref:Universal stress protein n=1 Tax=Acinetobacter haemolyticus TaxID=29430 RepID=A0A857IHW7_ACIHA|nr:universal stress protein [Acinetobacter haemolyticus]QHI09486.1 universal stress protein [Acinetobacter haemolyticus]QHI12750.1 universal stress protein [Acinetobacter haemolyticus]
MSYQNILVPVDDSPISYAAVEHARSLAKLSGAKVTVLSVVAVDPFVGVDFYQVAPAITDHFMQAEAHAKNQLQEIAQSFAENGVDVTTKIHHGIATDGILFVADEIGADLIVMGSRGRTGVKRLLLGSVARTVLTESHIPVLIIKQ